MKIKSFHAFVSQCHAIYMLCYQLGIGLEYPEAWKDLENLHYKMVERIDEEWTTRFTELRFDLVGFKNIFVVLKDDLKCPLTMPTTHLEIWRKLYKRVNELGIVLKILSLIKFESFN